MYQKNAVKKNNVDLFLIGEEGKVKENIFVNIIYKLLVKKKY